LKRAHCTQLEVESRDKVIVIHLEIENSIEFGAPMWLKAWQGTSPDH